MESLIGIFKENWQWRSQIWSIAVFDMKKANRNTVLGWVWFLVQPAIYIFCFWFALDIGLKAGRVAPGEAPYVLWLTAGIIPWQFMSKMLTSGADVYHGKSFLVKKVRFPITAISCEFTLHAIMVYLIRSLLVSVVFLFCGQPIGLYLLQLPLLTAIMFFFWWFYSMLVSPLCALSKDLKNLVSAFSTPMFWLSGVIFNVRDLPVAFAREILYFNPATFFVEAYRDIVYSKMWLWDDPRLCVTFAVVFVATVVGALIMQKRMREAIPDAL